MEYMKEKIKITKDLTPKEMQCVIGGCPAIFETNKGSYAVIGRVINAKSLGVKDRVGKDEILIEVPKGLIDNKS